MSKKLAKKEYVDYVNLRLDLIDVKKQIVVTDKGNTLHIVIPYDRMLYDKGYMIISGTLNMKPYLGILNYSRTNATLTHVISQGDNLRILTSYAEENRLVRVILFIASYSVVTLDCNDYFEKALL